MKLAYKTKKTHINSQADKSQLKAHNAHEVSFILVAKGVIGFRESAHIVKVAEATSCSISISSGKKFGTTASILSLVNLGITEGKSLVLSIYGKRNEEAFREVSKIISGETDSNS